jgi:hypothetical protein
MVPDVMLIAEQIAAVRVTANTPYSLVYKHSFGLCLRKAVVIFFFITVADLL